MRQQPVEPHRDTEARQDVDDGEDEQVAGTQQSVPHLPDGDDEPRDGQACTSPVIVRSSVSCSTGSTSARSWTERGTASGTGVATMAGVLLVASS